MEAYRYKAMNAQGRMIQGRVDAVNPADLELRLSRLGLDLVNFRELSSRAKNITGRGVKRTDLITFCFHLEHLVRAGVPILEGLSDIRDTVDNKRLREVTAAIIEAIEGGKNLSGAMAEFPFVFSPVFVSLIRAGEESGQLNRVLGKIIENLKWQDEQIAYTKKLLVYPAIVTVIVIAVLFFLMLYVVPQLISFLATMGQELPLQTKALIATSAFMTEYWYVVLLTPIILIGSVVVGFKTNPKFAERIDNIILRMPLIGPVMKKLIVTRVCQVFSIMYSSGITVLDSIRSAEDVSGNRAVATALRDAGRMIADGGGISASFAATGLFPPLVVRMLQVGENTGALEEALDNVSYFYTRDVAETIERLQEMIMPGITVVLGALLFWIMASVLGPIYDLFTQIDF
ncbi:MAG: type II secretion system F family protein [Gammaproteobacteria bacterium]|nr:type II secretion system F family protein [Gammaproteobacteria bacterium]